MERAPGLFSHRFVPPKGRPRFMTLCRGTMARSLLGRVGMRAPGSVGSAPSLGAALFEIAKLYGFLSWPRLKKHVVDQTIAGKLKQAIDRDDLDEVRALLS